MPINDLRLDDCPNLADLSPLAGDKELSILTLPPNATDVEFLRSMPSLTYLGYSTDPGNRWLPDKTAAQFWSDYDSHASLREFHHQLNSIYPKVSVLEQSDGGWRVWFPDPSPELTDLSILRGRPISILSIMNSSVTDLSSLHGMSLKVLLLIGTQVTDLTPLSGMPLETLQLNAFVTDLSPLRGMPLQALLMDTTEFILAAAKPVAERAAFLDRECGGTRPCAPVLKPCSWRTTNPSRSWMPPLGEGGCGTVYVAEQSEPVRRRVALKVIKLGMDTKQVIARFEAERQALAMMDHPNIAKVLDGGATENGRPYFVMELVRGIKITEYCDQATLTTAERLDLFIKVCQAIQHAHQKGIIHRDIKPSNILVTLHDGAPVPKVIDFGIAKASEGRLTDATIYTQLHQFIGTPAYMSPEQAEMTGLDIDTRSDIYSLGVLLYELLAGNTPFDAKELMAQGIDTMRKTIREQEPPRPSTRFATLEDKESTTTAKRRSVEKSKLVHQLKGDLDWIVMKCLEKDRTRRYDTANGLAADLKRHLGNEPVLARPPSHSAAGKGA
jgi:hypothetical protein